MSTRITRKRLCRRAAALLLCPAMLLSAIQGAHADEDNGAWFGVFANGALPPPLNDSTSSWRLWLDAQLRFGDDASRFSQGLVRPGVGYTLSEAWAVGWVRLYSNRAAVRQPANCRTTELGADHLERGSRFDQALFTNAIGAAIL
jgi:hypothetical protein